MNLEIPLETNRLRLIPITPEKIHALYSAQSKKEIMDFFGFDDASYEHYKGMHEKGMETHRLSLLFFLIIDKERDLPIGECGFHTWNKSHFRAELFYTLRREEDKRKGFMTEALKAVLNYGFNEMELHRVEALVAAWNEPSVKLLQRYQFIKEGTMREDYYVNGKHEDSDCYSLLKGEWDKQEF